MKPQISQEVRDHLVGIGHVTEDLEVRWNLHVQLYGTSQECCDVLHWAAPELFKIIEVELRRSVYLTICTLTEKATTYGKENRSLLRLCEMIPLEHQQALDLDRRVKEAKSLADPFRKHRNRLIAHDSLDIPVFTSADDPRMDDIDLPGLSRSHVNSAIEKIRSPVAALHEFYGITFGHGWMPGDGSLLIQRLKRLRSQAPTAQESIEDLGAAWGFDAGRC